MMQKKPKMAFLKLLLRHEYSMIVTFVCV